ncbi:hypothetical protein YN1HA_26190 [Sulfurisphaera ohwakuensis]
MEIITLDELISELSLKLSTEYEHRVLGILFMLIEIFSYTFMLNLLIKINHAYVNYAQKV